MISTLIKFTSEYSRRLNLSLSGLFMEKVESFFIKTIIVSGLIFCYHVTHAQEKRLDYQVIKNGKNIGTLRVNEVREGEKISLKMNSEIKTKVVFTITAMGTEAAVFNKGVLTSSIFTQTVNGKEKINKKTSHKGSYYMVNNNGKETRVNHAAIVYNMVCLYTIEPLNKILIYSDKHSAFLAVKKVKDHHYQVTFPGGNFNEYFYENGVCKKIKVESSLYSLTMELKL